MRFFWLVLVLSFVSGTALAKGASKQEAERIVEKFGRAVDKVNRAQLAAPKAKDEDALAKKLPAAARKGLARLLDMEDGEAKWFALTAYARHAAELDLEDDLERIEKAFAKAPDEAREGLGHYVSRERFLLHALRVSPGYAKAFAETFDGVLATYDEVFGFKEYSKVPGKKIRVFVHREEKPRPPQFAPQYRYHSAIDFPVKKGDVFTSPTKDGKFLFYGLCHEVGHLIAMWGHRKLQEDHHAWAHYTGITVVDACEKARWAKQLRDKRWRSVDVDRKKLKDTPPSVTNRDGMLRLLIELHDLVGTKRIGAALNVMDDKRMGHRINQVRYYRLAELAKALLAGTKSKKQRAKIRALFSE